MVAKARLSGQLPAPALVRSGRVELWLEMKLPDAEARAKILAALVANLPDELRGLDAPPLVAATEGFTGADLKALIEDGIRVNAVAPGPIWTPLIPASFEAERVAQHGASVPMKRAGQPNEVAPCYVFLASDDASYMSGQVLHPNGGNVVGS